MFPSGPIGYLQETSANVYQPAGMHRNELHGILRINDGKDEREPETDQEDWKRRDPDKGSGFLKWAPERILDVKTGRVTLISQLRVTLQKRDF